MTPITARFTSVVRAENAALSSAVRSLDSRMQEAITLFNVIMVLDE